MVKLAETAAGDCYIIATHGDPGTGKSEFSASCNSDRSVLFTDLNGIRTFKNIRVRSLYPNFNPELEIVEDDPNLKTIQAFNKYKKRIEEYLNPPLLDTWDWMILDDMGIWKRWARLEGAKINEAGERSKSWAKAKETGTLLPTEADFGTEISLLEDFLHDLTQGCRLANKNLIINCHSKFFITKDRKTKEETLRKIEPAFTGKQSPRTLMGEFDFVLYMTRVGKGTNSRVSFQCHPDDIVVAKDRDSIFATTEYDLTIGKIIERSKEYRGKLLKDISTKK